ncbi:MAG: SMI1/KNR4 family protein [Campylobacterales bacterium]|nr:SMI1/KNR4 family protein [Campylobacterales bacterium]HEO99416.1 SMI1/KNR4 family protein [Campylobacterota bacterium]
MPFPVDEKYIKETEEKLSVKFPTSFIDSMMKNNGGEISTDNDDWELYPFWDKSDKKRLARTCNDIVKETNNAKKWTNFPSNAIAIANNGCGDQMVFLNENGTLRNTVYFWSHETGELLPIADDFLQLEEA